MSCSSATVALQGQNINIVVSVRTPADGTFILGASLVDSQRLFTNDSDRDKTIALRVGENGNSRDFTVPANVAPGMYTVAAAVWPVGQVGNGSPLAKADCAALAVNAPPTTTTAPSTTVPIAFSMTCNGPGSIKAGDTIIVSATIVSPVNGKFVLGASLVDDRRTFFSDPSNDLLTDLNAGSSSRSRPFKLPGTLAAGRYTLIAALWPQGKVGVGQALTTSDCTLYEVQ